jgi:thioredoxin reductase (NADPH)
MTKQAVKQKSVDVLVIGAGPAGLTAALYTARSGKKTLVLAGKSSSKLELDYLVENYPGFLSINSQDLLKKFQEHAVHFGAEILEADAMDINLSMDPKFVVTKEHMIEAQSVIIATGRPTAAKNRIPGEESLVGMGVSYCANCDGPLYRGKKVLAIGNTEESAEDVLALLQMGVEVEWCTGDGKSALASQTLVQEAVAAGVLLRENSQVKEIKGEGRVQEARIEQDGQEFTIEVDGAFIFRDIPFSSLYAKAALDIDHRDCVITDHSQKTKLDGVYAAGDITCGGLQIVTGAGQGARAAMSVLKYLRQKK